MCHGEVYESVSKIRQMNENTHSYILLVSDPKYIYNLSCRKLYFFYKLSSFNVIDSKKFALL